MTRTASPPPPTRLADEAELDRTDVTGPWPGTSVAFGGRELFVRTTPVSDGADGAAAAAGAEPALCVHGLGGSAVNWTELAGLMRRRLAAESIDLPGHGRSGPAPDRDYSPEAHARAVIAYLEHSARGPVHLIGNSLGGAVSVRVAARRPDLVRTLTLISPAVPDVRLRLHPLRNNPRMAVLATPGVGELAMRLLSSNAPATRVQATIRLCFADPTRFSARRLAESIAEATYRQQLPWANEALLRSMRALGRAQVAERGRTWADLRAIAAPTLVVWGRRDRLVAPDLAQHVAGLVADVRLLLLDDIGHTPQMEDPVTTARAVLALVTDAGAERR
jgi:pimeloyl-ACP methyl ester carboxylesterase